MAQTVERRKPLKVYSGQTVITTVSQAVGSSADLVASEVTVKAMVSNADPVYVGDSTVTTSTGFELRAGQQITITAGSPDDVHVIGTLADDVSWIAS